MSRRSDIAARVIGKLGGARRVAKLLGLNPTAVYKWTYERDRGGTGGLIPAEHQQALLDIGRREGCDLTPSDFFEKPTSRPDGSSGCRDGDVGAAANPSL